MPAGSTGRGGSGHAARPDAPAAASAGGGAGLGGREVAERRGRRRRQGLRPHGQPELTAVQHAPAVELEAPAVVPARPDDEDPRPGPAAGGGEAVQQLARRGRRGLGQHEELRDRGAAVVGAAVEDAPHDVVEDVVEPVGDVQAVVDGGRGEAEPHHRHPQVVRPALGGQLHPHGQRDEPGGPGVAEDRHGPAGGEEVGQHPSRPVPAQRHEPGQRTGPPAAGLRRRQGQDPPVPRVARDERGRRVELRRGQRELDGVGGQPGGAHHRRGVAERPHGAVEEPGARPVGAEHDRRADGRRGRVERRHRRPERAVVLALGAAEAQGRAHAVGQHLGVDEVPRQVRGRVLQGRALPVGDRRLFGSLRLLGSLRLFGRGRGRLLGRGHLGSRRRGGVRVGRRRGRGERGGHRVDARVPGQVDQAGARGVAGHEQGPARPDPALLGDERPARGAPGGVERQDVAVAGAGAQVGLGELPDPHRLRPGRDDEQPAPAARGGQRERAAAHAGRAPPQRRRRERRDHPGGEATGQALLPGHRERHPRRHARAAQAGVQLHPEGDDRRQHRHGGEQDDRGGCAPERDEHRHRGDGEGGEPGRRGGAQPAARRRRRAPQPTQAPARVRSAVLAADDHDGAAHHEQQRRHQVLVHQAGSLSGSSARSSSRTSAPVRSRAERISHDRLNRSVHSPASVPAATGS